MLDILPEEQVIDTEETKEDQLFSWALELDGLQNQTFLTTEQYGLVKARVAQLKTFHPLIYNTTMLQGSKGTGKSITAVGMSYFMRTVFGLDTVVVGTSLDLNDKFGPNTFLDEREFVEQLASITQVGKDTTIEELKVPIDQALKEMGIKIHGSLLIFDEAYKLFDARSPNDKLVKLFGYFIAQSRHYKCTILLLAPSRDDLDKRVRRQIDYLGDCSKNERRNTIITRFRSLKSHESWTLETYIPNYQHMYDTHAFVGFRTKQMQIKDL